MEERKFIKRKNKALKEHNECLFISACTDLANLYIDEGRYELAIGEYTEISKIHKKNNKVLDYAIANRGIGEAYLELRQFNEALSHEKIYLDEARDAESKLEEQRALATIGHIYLTKHLENPEEGNMTNLNRANKYLRKSLAVCQDLTNEISKLEKADMTARILSNLGLVQESLGDMEQALKLINKSVQLCKANDIYEQLLRGYRSLASIFEKKEDCTSVLHYYNLAVETAKKIKDKPQLLATALQSKAVVLVKLGNFSGAKSTLSKAYKLKSPNAEERAMIERNLKIIIAMLRTEEKLLKVDSSDYEELKVLYEKMGDGACELKCYKKAIDYYKKMLDSVEKSGFGDVATCYYSLAETLKDDGQYDEAINYYELELGLRAGNLIDNLNTLSKIADTKEICNCDTSEVVGVYERAIELCENFGNSHEQGRMMKRLIVYLKRHDKRSDAFEWERKFDEFDYQSSDSDVVDEVLTPTIGDDVTLDHLSDSDTEPTQMTSRTRRVKSSAIKRNPKGETQLHTACIGGKLPVVRHLLEQGHPVNVRDHCGWLPLHEACICGHFSIVKLLIEKGAAINDRGGALCTGVTPLHDAASNGHLEIVKYLLDEGANPLAKTDQGDTALSHLEVWFEKNHSDLDDVSNDLYKELSMRMLSSLNKAGQSTSSFMRPSPPQLPTRGHFLRRSSTIGLEETSSLPSTSSTPSSGVKKSNNIAADDYRSVIANLRRNQSSTASIDKANNKRSALISADEVEEDWLEDDLPKIHKKRKTNSPIKATPVSRRSFTDESSNDCVDMESDVGVRRQIDDDLNVNSLPDCSGIIDVGSDNDSVDSFTSWQSQKSTCHLLQRHQNRSTLKKRKFQTKLTSFGHIRNLTDGDRSPRSGTPSLRTHSFDNGIEPPTIDPMLSVDVQINGKLFRVPIVMSQVNTCTIKWLAEDAANRYAKKEYVKPSLELQTKNGAILGDDDPLNVLFPPGRAFAEAEIVEARVIKWNIPPLIQRFKEVCFDMNVEPTVMICDRLERISTSLDLCNMALSGFTLNPLFKSLIKQTNLIELNLSGNFLTTENVQLLSAALPTLENLTKLNLNCTGLTSEHFALLHFDNKTLTCLDLSDNYLSDLVNLANLAGNLKMLNLSSNQLSHIPNDVEFPFKSLENLDISDNRFGNSSIVKFIDSMDPNRLKKLNCSRNQIESGLVRQIFTIFFEKNTTGKIPLEDLNLSRCLVEDFEISEFLRLMDNVKILDLSYNSGLTGITLQKLLQIDSLKQLNLCGCSNILKYFDAISNEALSDQFKCQMKISVSTLEERVRQSAADRLKDNMNRVEFDRITFFYS